MRTIANFFNGFGKILQVPISHADAINVLETVEPADHTDLERKVHLKHGKSNWIAPLYDEVYENGIVSRSHAIEVVQSSRPSQYLHETRFRREWYPHFEGRHTIFKNDKSRERHYLDLLYTLPSHGICDETRKISIKFETYYFLEQLYKGLKKECAGRELEEQLR